MDCFLTMFGPNCASGAASYKGKSPQRVTNAGKASTRFASETKTLALSLHAQTLRAMYLKIETAGLMKLVMAINFNNAAVHKITIYASAQKLSGPTQPDKTQHQHQMKQPPKTKTMMPT